MAGHVRQLVRRRRRGCVAAISLSTAFLAPGTSIVPCSSPTRRIVISPPGPGSVFTWATPLARSDRSAHTQAICSRGGSRPTSMLPRCWQAVTSPTAPLAFRAATAPWRGRGRTAPRSPPTSSGRATTSSSSAAHRTARSSRRPARSSRYRRTRRADRRRRRRMAGDDDVPLVDPVVRLGLRAAAALAPGPPRRAPTRPPAMHATVTPWWAPPDRLDPRTLTVLGLLAAASMSSAFVNTLFTQTVKFAADDFGVGDSGIGVAGGVVRAGIILVAAGRRASPIALGRRRTVIGDGRARRRSSPPLGALAPTFPIARRHPDRRPTARPGARLPRRRRRRRGDAPQQPGVRGERAGDGQRARRRRRRDRAAARRHLGRLAGGSSTSSP